MVCFNGDINEFNSVVAPDRSEWINALGRHF
jgi:hypothetical protein